MKNSDRKKQIPDHAIRPERVAKFSRSFVQNRQKDEFKIQPDVF